MTEKQIAIWAFIAGFAFGLAFVAVMMFIKKGTLQ